MSKSEAESRLKEIAVFQRDERKRQQVWLLRDDPHYKHLALGYDENDRVRYVTAFSDPAKERQRFTDIGDISKGTPEIVKPHHRYTWEVQPEGDRPGYFVTVYGADPEFLSSVSLMRTAQSDQSMQE